MDSRELLLLLESTLSGESSRMKYAEQRLLQLREKVGFAPLLLEIVTQNDAEPGVRQAAALYLKNFIMNFWSGPDDNVDGQNVIFRESDRAIIRNGLVQTIVHAPERIQIHLATCVWLIVKYDFPVKWPQLVSTIEMHLQTNGGLLCLHQLAKYNAHQMAEVRKPVNGALSLLLPKTYNFMVNLMSSEQTVECVLMQKQILKIFYSLIRFCLPLDLITNEVFGKWMEVCHRSINSPVPDLSQLDEDERLESPWWKVKKWALHICVRSFERYGSPGKVANEEYQKFAEWYLPTFTGGILEALLNLLDHYRKNIYVSPRVLHGILIYIKIAVGQSYSWKLVQPHMAAIIRDVLFPIMHYTAEDEEMWQDDPLEYVRTKFSAVSENHSVALVPSAEYLLLTACKYRKGILPDVIRFLNDYLKPSIDPKIKDGALHMLGSLAEVLVRRKEYRNDIEKMLALCILPELKSPQGHMRARACWVLHKFSTHRFNDQQGLVQVVQLVTNALLTDKDLPVKVEAAVTLEMYLAMQNNVAEYLRPAVQQIILELLNIMSYTEIDELNGVMQKIVFQFTDELSPIADNICQQLATTFLKIQASTIDEPMEDRILAATGVINTIENLLMAFEDSPEISTKLHGTVVQLIYNIFSQTDYDLSDFLDEAFSLIYLLTANSISPEKWQMLDFLHDLFDRSHMVEHHFVDLMPALHNYVTVDAQAFLSNPNHAMHIFDLCSKVLTSTKTCHEGKCHAAKLIEVIVLQSNQMDPTPFVRLSLHTLRNGIEAPKLRAFCLQILMAALYNNPVSMLQILHEEPQLNNESMDAHFIRQWIGDTRYFFGVHNRRLYVLALCKVMCLGEKKPVILSKMADQILPALLNVFKGLTRAYHARELEGRKRSHENGGEGSDDSGESDDDDVDGCSSETSDESSDFNLDDAEVSLEHYFTAIDEDSQSANYIDEHIAFRQTMETLNSKDPHFYQLLTQNLSADVQSGLQDVIQQAEGLHGLIMRAQA